MCVGVIWHAKERTGKPVRGRLDSALFFCVWETSVNHCVPACEASSGIEAGVPFCVLELRAKSNECQGKLAHR